MTRPTLLIVVGVLSMACILLIEFGTSNVGRPGASLYQRIGGPLGATTIVDGFLAHIGSDDRLDIGLAEADMGHLRGPLTDLLCEATGGPCWYEGDGMLEVRRRPGVTVGVFGIMVQHFTAAMTDAGVGLYDRYAAMEAYTGMHDAIVGQGLRHPDAAPGGEFQVPGG